ncbi:MAG: hypothetical protein ACRCYC_15500 [Paraclostridium sp.]|uniref:hypothetical protein n=1 Tax=Paraclostridium sp. TaxID=2023273 RepID=UPI003A9A9282
MKNLINWMCLISIMGLVLQVMAHISSEVISDINKKDKKRKRIIRTDKRVEKPRVSNDINYYTEKIAK